MKKSKLQVFQRGVFLLLLVLLVVLLVVLLIFGNSVTIQERGTPACNKIEEINRRELDDGVIEFTFSLPPAIPMDTELTMFQSHQWITLWIGDEQIYSLQRSEKLPFVHTPGSKWITLPVCREDGGRLVRVRMEPAYENLVADELEIYLGSSLEVYRAQFLRSMPAMILSLCNIFVGLLLLGVAVYCKCTKRDGMDVLSLGLLGITIGLWQLTNNDFSPFLLRGKEIFLYYVSVTMMLVCMIPLVRSIGIRLNGESKPLLRWYQIGIAVAASTQIVLQLTGLIDLRQMFPLTHGGIFFGAMLLIGGTIFERHQGRNAGYSWILAVGVLCDLVLYYILGTASGLILVLSAVLIFTLLEGIDFLRRHMEQGRLLAEKEIQLTNSRAMTMTSQIRSHFVFNILNAISGMCKYDPEKADDTIVRFARYLRNNIDIMEDDRMIPFKTELQRLEDYILLEQVRFGDRLRFVTELTVTDFLLPPLVLQPIVENAIKHGIVKKQNGGTIVLRTWEEEKRIFISVEDDGVGFERSELEKKQSVGLRNIRFRLHHLVHGTLILDSEPGRGTQAVITLPRKETSL